MKVMEDDGNKAVVEGEGIVWIETDDLDAMPSQSHHVQTTVALGAIETITKRG